MNIYLNKYLKYKKKYYKIKYGGKIKNNSIEIFRCYLDILLYKLNIYEKDWSKIRKNDPNYWHVKQKYEETTKDSTKNNGFFQKMYMNTPFLKDVFTSTKEAQARVTVIYDKYIRVGNENVCMPHGIGLREVCKENEDFYKWYDPNDPDNKKELNPQEIGKNIGKEKIPSYLKFIDKKFNSLSKIKYMIERCLFNQDYVDKEKIKAIIIQLYVKTIYTKDRLKSVDCNKRINHANMFLIKINRPEDKPIELVFQYFDPNTKQAVYLKERFEKYAEEINKVSEGKYKITGVEKLDFKIEKSAIKGKKSAIHDIFPYKWVNSGICGSVTWIIFILWTKVFSVVEDFDDFYTDIIDILYIQARLDYVNGSLYKEILKKKFAICNNPELIKADIDRENKKIYEALGDIKKEKIKECYIDFLYIVYMFLQKNSSIDQIIEYIYNFKLNEFKLNELYNKEILLGKTDLSAEFAKKAASYRTEYEKVIKQLVNKNNEEIKKKLEYLKKLKEVNKINTKKPAITKEIDYYKLYNKEPPILITNSYSSN